MSKLFLATKEGLLLWRLALTNVTLYALISCGGVWLSSTSSISAEQWAAMSSFDKSKIYIGVLLVGFGVVKAFLDKTMSDIKDDEAAAAPPPPKAP